MKRFLKDPMVILLLVIMVFDSFRYGDFDDPKAWILEKLLILPGIIIGLSFHEFSHAFVSDRLGDPTPKSQGRVTVNPAAHIDPVGFLALIFIGFGWGQAVQINPSYYKKPRRDELLVSLAGVTMNLFLAVVFMGVVRLYLQFWPEFAFTTTLGSVIRSILFNVVQINVVLLVFNLMPIPPLDGFNALANIFNFRNSEIYYRLYSGGMILLLVVIILDIPSRVLSPIMMWILNGLMMLFQF